MCANVQILLSLLEQLLLLCSLGFSRESAFCLSYSIPASTLVTSRTFLKHKSEPVTPLMKILLWLPMIKVVSLASVCRLPHPSIVWSQQLSFRTQLFLKVWSFHSLVYTVSSAWSCTFPHTSLAIEILLTQAPDQPSPSWEVFLDLFIKSKTLLLLHFHRVLLVQQRRIIFFLLHIIIKAKTVSDLGQMLGT